MQRNIPNSVLPYYQDLDPVRRNYLLEIRAHILARFPDALEEIKYSMPTFIVAGVPLCGILANKKHIGFYPYAGNLISEITAISNHFHFTTGSWHIPYSKPLPFAEMDSLIDLKLGMMK